MSKKNETVSEALRSREGQSVCSTEGLQGFPIKIDFRDFASITEEPTFQLRPKFQAASVWSYDAKKGEFDDGAFSQSSFYMQGKHYRIMFIKVVNRGTHWQWGAEHIAELQVWGVTGEKEYGVICIPIMSGSKNDMGMYFESMCAGSVTTDLGRVFPQGDNVNMYFYVSCNPYVLVGKNYVPLNVGSTNVHVVFFTQPIAIAADIYKKYVTNNIRPSGFPLKIMPPGVVYNDLMETDAARTVKMTKMYDTTLDKKKLSIFKKRGFTIPGVKGAAPSSVKVFQVSEESLENGTYKADLEAAQDADSYSAKLKARREAEKVKIDPPSAFIQPGTMSRLIGSIIGIVFLVLIIMAIWYYMKRAFIPVTDAGLSVAEAAVEINPPSTK
jgi:hypothetical protein